MDCGPTCLRMIAKHYGRNYSIQHLRNQSQINREGVSLLGLSEAAEKIGIKTVAAKLSFDQLKEEAPLPCIIHWNQYHFVVVYKVKKENIYIADPAKGLLSFSKEEFLQHWQGKETTGICLLLEPTTRFYEEADEKEPKLNFLSIFRYLFSYKKLLLQLGLGLLIGSLLQLVFPFLTQSIVDTGINTQNLNFIIVVLIAQTTLIIGRTSIEFIRSWILLHISTRINISILSDFLIKLMRLPMSFFDTKMTGDILQRMNDHNRIESFLTGTALNTLFSLFNLVIFSVVLVYYNLSIFGVFAISSICYTLWISFFMKQRKTLDHKRFSSSAENQSKVMQLIGGMQEIKLNGCEQQKRWEWEGVQAKLFKYNIKGLALNQYQQAGAFFINEGKNIFITFLAAKAVIDGHITLGAMMAVQYIVGQLNSPIEQFIIFLRSAQDASISMERLNEIHTLEDEEPKDKQFIDHLPETKSIQLKNVSFQYPGAGNELVLKDITLTIPKGKTTAIVGMSGSGKTTILKLLLRFYDLKTGEMRVGETNLNNISHKLWRSECGVVMQDGFIFSDSIAKNIAIGDEQPNMTRLLHACKTANILDFVEGLPLGFNTKIGAEGNGISQGQKQRILIARAVYKDPEYIFFDEATNALDANNESIIMENLEQFLKNRTVIVVAHRLSTVKNADNIVVLDRGEIIEQGTHTELTALKGSYYHLVKNQLALGN